MILHPSISIEDAACWGGGHSARKVFLDSSSLFMPLTEHFEKKQPHGAIYGRIVAASTHVVTRESEIFAVTRKSSLG